MLGQEQREKALLLGRIRERSCRALSTGSSTAALLSPLASNAEPTSYSSASSNGFPGEEEEDSVFKSFPDRRQLHIFQFSLRPHIPPRETQGYKSSNPDTEIGSVQTLDLGLGDTGAVCGATDGGWRIQEDESALYTGASNMATHIPRSRNQGTRSPP